MGKFGEIGSVYCEDFGDYTVLSEHYNVCLITMKTEITTVRWEQVTSHIWTNDDYFTDAYMHHTASMSYGNAYCLFGTKPLP